MNIPGPVTERMPLQLKFALAGVVLHALGVAVGGWLFLDDIRSRLDHGQSAPPMGVAWMGATLMFLLAALLAVCVVLARRRYGWIRITVLVYECLMAVATFFVLLADPETAGLLALGIAVFIAATMLTPSTRGWFSGPRPAPAGPPPAPFRHHTSHDQ